MDRIQFKIGDKVFALKPSIFPRPGVLGTYAEYVALPEETVALAPDGIPLEEAAGAPVVTLTAWQALEALSPSPSQRLLILSSSGGVGAMAVQLAKGRGLYVVGTAGARNLDYVRGLGADEVAPEPPARRTAPDIARQTRNGPRARRPMRAGSHAPHGALLERCDQRNPYRAARPDRPTRACQSPRILSRRRRRSWTTPVGRSR